MQIARHVNDEQTLAAFADAGRFDGIEIDIVRAEEWMVQEETPGRAAPTIREFLHQVEDFAGHERAERLKTMIQVKGDTLTHEHADALLDHCDEFVRDMEIRFVGYSPEVMNTLAHAAMSREIPYACQVYMQEDDIRGHVQWSKRHALGLPEDIGYHLRLHAFTPSRRPTYEEAMATGRRISTTGWNPLYKGWRNHDLSDIWNLRRR